MQLLLIEKRAVQPIYVVDVGRDSTLQELQTMAAMRQALLPRLTDESLLAPTQVVIGSDYPPPPKHVEIGERIRESMRLGSQYVWLTGPAEALGWRGVEMSVETRTTGRSDWQKLIFAEPGKLKDTDEASMFKYWSFPVVNLTKEDMRRIADEHGFLDLLLQRWFCFHPVWGQPCGRCRPCRLAVREEVHFAHPALVRHGGAVAQGREAVGPPEFVPVVHRPAGGTGVRAVPSGERLLLARPRSCADRPWALPVMRHQVGWR